MHRPQTGGGAARNRAPTSSEANASASASERRPASLSAVRSRRRPGAAPNEVPARRGGPGSLEVGALRRPDARAVPGSSGRPRRAIRPRPLQRDADTPVRSLLNAGLRQGCRRGGAASSASARPSCGGPSSACRSIAAWRTPARSRGALCSFTSILTRLPRPLPKKLSRPSRAGRRPAPALRRDGWAFRPRMGSAEWEGLGSEAHVHR